MSRLNAQNKAQGHRLGIPTNRDLQQKLTYQQLLNLNHDLTKENQQLKNIGNRLGQELKQLHSQFQIKPRNENVDLYAAIGNHPILHHYQLTLIPLLDAYQEKIQNFQAGFQTINDQFINLEKKYQEVIKDNEKLRALLNEKNTELIDLYKNNSSQKLGADFNQIILQQVNQKQKFLSEENNKFEREYTRYKSENQKNIKELQELKRKFQETSSRNRQFQINQRQLDSELASLKENTFNLQLKNNEIQGQKKKIQNDLQRALSQLNLLNKDRDGLLRNYENLKGRYQRDISQSKLQGQENSSSGFNFTNNNAIDTGMKQTFEVVQQMNDDTHKKLAKLQKEYQNLVRQKNKGKELQDQYKLNHEESLNKIAQLKKKIDGLQSQSKKLELNDTKNKKLLEQFIQKSKSDIQRIKTQHQESLDRLEDEHLAKIQAKQRKINEVQESLDRIKLEKDKLEQENSIFSTLNKQNKGTKTKDSDRMVQKLKEKMGINQQLFREQLQIVENDNTYLKRQTESYKQDNKDKSQEIRRLKQDLQKTNKQLVQVTEQKNIIINEIKRVRNEYQVNLKDKERLFESKIKEIKMVVEEADRRRKAEREKVSQASREYKRVLEEIKSTYQERIRVLEGENAANIKSRKIEERY